MARARGRGLVLSVPQRFDGALAAMLALGLPALAALTGLRDATDTPPLARKAAAPPGLSDLVLLADAGAAWRPAPARAFAILPPDSAGLPEGTAPAATPLPAAFR